MGSRGFVYSDWNSGKDSTIEPGYFNPNRQSGSGGAGESQSIEDLQNQIGAINLELEALKNTLNQVKDTVDNMQPYDLPIASQDTLGVIKVGQGLDINNGVLATNSKTASFDGGSDFVSTNLEDAIKEANHNAGESVIDEVLILN